MAYMSQEKKNQIAPVVKAILKEHGLKGSLSVHHHSSLVLTIKSGKIDFFGPASGVDGWEAQDGGRYTRVNHHWIGDHHWGDEATPVLLALKAAMDAGNHDNSRIEIDHFDVGWYIDINIGKWDKAYVVTA